MVRKKQSFGDNLIDIVLYIIITMTAITTLYPLVNVLAVSFSEYSGYVANPLMVIPKMFTLEAYKMVFKYPNLLISYKNTIFITVAGTILGVALSALTAYPLSKKALPGKPIFMGMIIFTMFF